jgi:hypothetical protein
MQQGQRFDRAFHLVALEISDHVPLHGCLGQRFTFVPQLLRSVLTDGQATGANQGGCQAAGNILADGNQGNITGIATAALRCCCDPILDGAQVAYQLFMKVSHQQ